MKNKILKILNDAKDASRVVAGVSTGNKNKALSQMAKALLKNSRYILLQNAKDISIAKKKGLSDAMIDRLRLTNKRIEDMAQAIKSVHGLKDPVGEVLRKWKRPNGLLIKKVRVPIGVVGIVYESRPNVTSDCAALCIKSGNACVLRGGSEAINSNLAIHRSITSEIEKFGIPREAIGMINVTDRAAVEVMLHADEYIDLIIPRGGESLIRHVAKNSTVPVVKHYKGVCHLYVDRSADLKKAKEIVLNAKVQRPGVCNAIENLLVHKDVARKFLPEAARMLEEADVELRGCEKTRKILGGIRAATDKDWYEEYLDLTLAIKIVNNVEEAIAFINKYGSSHSDAIVTKNKKAADKFLNNVDSACVYLNASTRFTDGHQFGMGAEIGISTDKIHARGPMALEELCTYKYIILGSGQIRQ
ncbi:MAG: glutamate-5-semialdehyde dehydrogenase [Candidatus Omnitrophica bacterium]|nr:glutamate-5-semialdehyde dehydrogenase [Candidatus Omnitrophota bacterium]